jgi:hypothetical protein
VYEETAQTEAEDAAIKTQAQVKPEKIPRWFTAPTPLRLMRSSPV